MAHEKLFQVGVKALITNREGKVLVMEVDTTGFTSPEQKHWDLAGGRIQEGQTVEEALRREVEEETGITQVDNITFFTSVISRIEIPLGNNQKAGLVLMVYRVRVPEGVEVKLSDEHEAYEWVELTEAAKRLEFKFSKDFSDALLRGGAAV
ncbi:MAG TPA: NUDIX hydrolase [Candidatus Saccharimonadales bacterium]|nr:NUDIX hydrolase [Candidatus Saccharimonadales bacterium]